MCISTANSTDTAVYRIDRDGQLKLNNSVFNVTTERSIMGYVDSDKKKTSVLANSWTATSNSCMRMMMGTNIVLMVSI